MVASLVLVVVLGFCGSCVCLETDVGSCGEGVVLISHSFSLYEAGE